ncbi:unnamed protein product [Citrullus colocynthis]|uniref:Uncharacterized protein n=1 Tax=Citrullus colocynthis TaxID=252529 RepID=A0ABP0ZC69_9ROSI
MEGKPKVAVNRVTTNQVFRQLLRDSSHLSKAPKTKKRPVKYQNMPSPQPPVKMKEGMQKEVQLNTRPSTIQEDKAITLYSSPASPLDEERALSPPPSPKIQNELFSSPTHKHRSPSPPCIDIGDLNIELREEASSAFREKF